MSRVRLNPYGASKSARKVSRRLGILRLKNPTRFRPREEDVVVNWGMPKNGVHALREVNPVHSIALASNKLYTLTKLQELGISVPEFSRELMDWESDTKLYARTTLSGHSGRGIVVGTQRELYDSGVSAPLYVKAIDKVAEYRAIVCNSKVVDFKQKKKKRGVEHDADVWSHSNGYVFARNDIFPPIGCGSLAIDAVEALGLDFGAVDIIEDARGILYVLEINTAFGIEGQTEELFCNELKEVIDAKKTETI